MLIMGVPKHFVFRIAVATLTALICGGATSALGTTYWVSTTGNDVNDGLDSMTAWASIDRGQQLGVLVSGDTINIMPGIYTFSVDIHLTTGGTSALPIVYRGLESNKYRAVLDGGGANASFYIDQKHLRVESLELTNTSEHGIDVAGDSSAVVDCYIHDVNKSGIYLEGSWNLISHNRITATGDHGIENRDSGTNNRIYNNTIALCNKNGVECQGNVLTVRIINNILVRNDKGINANALNLAAHNDVWGNANTNYGGGIADSAGGISVDPGLISPQTGNFDVKDSSLVIDAGMYLGFPYTGFAPDMGAIEHVAHPPTVYYVSVIGNNKLDGLTPATAWRNIDYGDANGLLYPGDTVMSLGGTYISGSTIGLKTPGTAAQPIVYVGGYDSTTTINGQGTANPLVLLAGSHTLFFNFTVTGADKAGVWTVADSIVVRECVLSQNGEDGVYVEGTHTLLERNLIVSNSRHGIHSRDLGANSWFHGNTIYGNGQKGIEFQANSITARIFNNIITGNDKGIDGNSNNVCGFNDVWNNKSGNYNGGVVDSAGGSSVDPLFVDSTVGDFYLQELSPCIDNGIDLGYGFVGLAPDLGAYEFIPPNYPPAIVSIGPKSIGEGQNLNFTITAEDPDFTIPALTAASVPASASFVDNGDGTGTFDFNPDYTQAGIYNLLFIASDGQLADTEVVVITVNNVNRPPLLAAIGPKSIMEGQTLSFGLAASDPDGTSPTLTVANLPTNASLTDNGDGTGEFAFTPSYSQAGLYNVTIYAGDGDLIDSELIAITVTPAPVSHVIVTPSDFVLEQMSSQQFTVTGYDDGNEVVADLTDSVTWSITDSLGSITTSGLYTAGPVVSPPDYYVIATYTAFISDTSVLQVAPVSTIDHIRIESLDGTAIDDTTLTTDNDSVTVYCRGYSIGDILVGDVAASWQLVGADSIGLVNTAVGISTTLELRRPGTGYIVASTADPHLDSTGPIICSAGVPAQTTISPDSATVSADSSLEFTYSTWDADGNTTEFQIVPSWSVIGSIGTINTTGIFEAVTVGSGNIVLNGAGLSDTTGPIVVFPGTPVKLQVWPDSFIMRRGDSLAFSTTSLDSDGNTTTGNLINWSVLGRMGMIDGNGLFVATRSGWGRIIAENAAAGLIDTTGQIIVEAVEISAIPLGSVSTHPGTRRSPVLALHLDNYYQTNQTIDSLTVRWAIRGSGSPAELLSSVDSVGLYIDTDGDSLLSANDSLVTIAAVASASTTIWPLSVEIPADSSLDLLIGCTISPFATDGDSLDIYVLAGDIVFSDTIVALLADSINSLGYTVIDGALAGQYSIEPAGNRDLKFVDTLVHLLTIDLPRNGYDTDTLNSFALRNAGSAIASNFDSLVLFVDDGDSTWSGAGDEKRLGSLQYTGDRWSVSGMAQPLVNPTSRFYVAAMLDAFPVANQTFIARIPVMGIEVSSGNDGPLDATLQSSDTLTIQSQESIHVTGTSIAAHAIRPGSATGPLLGFQVINSYLHAVSLDSIRFGLRLVDPDGASQSELDSQIDSVAVYINRDGNHAVLGDADTLIATGTVSNGAVMLDMGGRALADRGVSEEFTLQAFLGRYTAKDANTISAGLNAASDFYFDSTYIVTGSYPIYNASTFSITSFAADAIILHPIASQNLSPGGSEVTVIDFELPRNGYIADSLISLLIQNLGTFDDNELTLDLMLRADKTTNGLTADDPLLGRFVKIGSRWRVSNLHFPLVTNTTRFVVTAMVKDSKAEGGSLQFEIDVQGAIYASGTNGPDDLSVGNTQSHLILPSNRITTIGIPVASAAIAPGSKGDLLLSFALYNGYVGQTKTLEAIRFSNTSRTRSTAAYADFETGQIQLYYDRNHDRQFNGDSLLGTGYMDNGSLLMTGLGVALAPESLSYFFIVGDVPLALVDSDSLAVGIDTHSDLAFKEQVSLNGDVPIVSGGYAIVDGSIAAQYKLDGIANRTLSPGDTNIAVFSFAPALNGDITDILLSVTLDNLGTATSSDLASVELWYDKNGDGVWQLTDSLLGQMLPSGARWTISGLNMSVQGTAPTLCAVADIATTANAARTIRFSLPIGGCSYASANDGPIDQPLSNDDEFSISYSGLSVRISPLEHSYSVGQPIVVRFAATNLSGSSIDSVVGEIVMVSNPGIVILDSAFAGPVTVGGGGSGDFSFYYTATGQGSVQWSLRAIALSTADTSAVLQSKVVAIQTAPAYAIVSFNDAIPTAVTRGQANVFPLSLGVSHPGTAGTMAALQIDSLTLTIEDGVGNPVSAASVLSRVTIATGQATLASLDTIAASSSIVLRFLEPLTILPVSQQLISVLVDVSPGASANEFALSLTDADAIAVADANSKLPVSLDPSLQFPARTASCRIDDPSDKLLVSTVSTLGSLVNRGQIDVKVIQFDVRHPGLPNSSQVQLSSVSMRFVDSSSSTFSATQLLDRISIIRNQFVIGTLSGIGLDKTVINVTLTAPVTLNPGESVSLNIVGDIGPTTSVSSFSMIIDDSTQFVVRDVSSGAILRAATDTMVLATGSVFPITTTEAQLKQAAVNPQGCLTSLVMPSVITGSDAQSLLELTVEYPVGSDYSSVHLDYVGLAVIDSIGAPINSQRLFDQIGYGVDGGPVTYLPSVSYVGALTLFSLGDSGVTIAPGTSHTIRLYADIEADPAGIDNFRLLLPDMESLGLIDATDMTRPLGLAATTGCSTSIPFATSLATVISRAGRPSYAVNKTPVRMAARGQTNVTLLQSELNYNGASSEGNVLFDGLIGRLAKRVGSSMAPAVPSAVFDTFELLLDGVLVPTQTTITDDTVALRLDNGYVIEAGTTIKMDIRCDISQNGELGNYLMIIDDSLSLQMSDAGLATAIVPILESGSLPLVSGEIAVTDVGLANSFSNYPNPFNPTTDGYTTIAYSLTEEARIDIDIYTITGDLVNRLATNTLRPAGSHQEDRWTGLNDIGRNVTPGTYYCRITVRYTSGKSETLNRKVAVLR